MFETLAAQIGAVFVVLVCGFAFLKGDEPERIWAGAYILCWFATLLVQEPNQTGVQWGVFGVDLIGLCVLIALAWRSRRTWILWATAFQLLTVMSHVVLMLHFRSSSMSYFTVLSLAGYGVLAALAIGTFWAWQERRAAGIE